MIKVTVQQARDAHRAFRRINEEVRLPQKPAWRIARLLNKLKPVLRDFEETQLRLFKDAGGVEKDGAIAISSPERVEEDGEAAWLEKQARHRATVEKLNEDLRALNKEEVEIDYDPIPLSLFEEDDKVAPERRMRFSANDFADAGPFITE